MNIERNKDMIKLDTFNIKNLKSVCEICKYNLEIFGDETISISKDNKIRLYLNEEEALVGLLDDLHSVNENFLKEGIVSLEIEKMIQNIYSLKENQN